MAEPVTVARPYAEAAFKLAAENNRLAPWSAMLATLEAVVADPDMQTCIADPNVSRPELESLVLGVVGDKLDGPARNLVQVLVHNDRLALVPQIRTMYEALRLEHEGVVEATIISALPLDDTQTRELVSALERKYQRKVSAAIETDPALIGGVRIIVGDNVIDATVRGRLDAMAVALTH
ncbi:MAG TPA: F0F1 ATP synthase subunit delta [Burkholderiales bacterium]|nr:F0F1 ATP synthase subunit delta [Burkholderiales bacterium]